MTKIEAHIKFSVFSIEGVESFLRKQMGFNEIPKHISSPKKFWNFLKNERA